MFCKATRIIVMCPDVDGPLAVTRRGELERCILRGQIVAG